MIDIGLLDPHPVVRAGLRRLISEQCGLRVTCEAASVNDASNLIRSATGPDVLVLELPEAGQRGLDAISKLQVQAPQTGLLLLTVYPAEHYALESLRQGARGYLNKNCEPAEIVSALRAISAGRRHFSAQVAELLANQVGHDCGGAAHQQLSVRETEVFYKLARGDTATAIATALKLSVKTVSTYRSRLLEKLGLTSNSDLTYYAVNKQLIA
jgi:DNA-binding NarL/FixJ family response regulator